MTNFLDVQSLKQMPDGICFKLELVRRASPIRIPIAETAFADFCSGAADKLRRKGKDAKALYIVSGDKDLLSLERFESIEIVTAKEFCERYKL